LLLLATASVVEAGITFSSGGETVVLVPDEDQITELNGVIVVNDGNFERMIAEKVPFLLEFYAPWCNVCKNFAPDYEGLAKEFKAAKNPISIAMIDAGKHLAKQKKYRVSGYPALRLFSHHNDRAVYYEGERSIPSIKKFLAERLKDPYQVLDTMEAADKFAASDSSVVIGFFGKDADISAFHTAAFEVKHVPIAFCTDSAIANQFTDKIPSVILLKQFDDKRTVLDNDFFLSQSESIVKFIGRNSARMVLDYEEGVDVKLREQHAFEHIFYVIR
jgi:protein disulfide-isomerase-like protein